MTAAAPPSSSCGRSRPDHLPRRGGGSSRPTTGRSPRPSEHDPHAVPALTALRERGLRTGLLSNTHWPRPLHERWLADAGLLGLLDVRVYTSDLQHLKPHREAFETLLPGCSRSTTPRRRCSGRPPPGRRVGGAARRDADGAADRPPGGRARRRARRRAARPGRPRGGGGPVAVSEEELDVVARACPRSLTGWGGTTPHADLLALAAEAPSAAAKPDRYGAGGVVARGRGAGAHPAAGARGGAVPSGTLAQQAALRHWCSRTPRVGCTQKRPPGAARGRRAARGAGPGAGRGGGATRSRGRAGRARSGAARRAARRAARARDRR